MLLGRRYKTVKPKAQATSYEMVRWLNACPLYRRLWVQVTKIHIKPWVIAPIYNSCAFMVRRGNPSKVLSHFVWNTVQLNHRETSSQVLLSIRAARHVCSYTHVCREHTCLGNATQDIPTGYPAGPTLIPPKSKQHKTSFIACQWNPADSDT